MILFLYGEDDFRSAEKLRSIKQKYIDASLGDTNLFTADLADRKMDFKEFSRIVLAQPFLAKKRLVIIKNLFKKSWKKLQEQVAFFLPKIPTSSVVLFYEKGIPDRRSKLFKTLNKPRVSQEFKKLNPSQLKSWIKNKLLENLKKNKAKVDYKFLEELILKSGNNLWQISAGIEKICLYLSAGSEEIDKEELKKLISEKTEAGIFYFIDVLACKNAKSTFNALHSLLNQGENEIYIFTMIIYQFRNLLMVKDLLQNQTENIPEYRLAGMISKKTKINPFVVRKTLQANRQFSLTELKRIYQILFNIDIKIKTGRIDPVLALDMLVTKICG